MAGEDLYQMLGLEKTASQADIKKAYYKLALQWHPDRNKAPEATAKFQALQRIYDVLSDPAKRQVYDRTGSLQDCEDMLQSDNFQDLYDAFREALKVTEEDIDSFAVSYRGSAEEKADLLRLYQAHSGNMARVFDWLMLSRPDLDSHRFMDAIETAIAAGEVQRLKAYKKWAAQVAATPRPTADPLAPPKKSKGGKGGKGKGGGGDGSDQMALVAAIRNKASAFNGMMAALEAKYGGSSGGGSGSSKCGGKKKTSKKAAAAEASAAEEASGGSNSKRKRGSKAAAAAAAAAGSSDDESDDGDAASDQGGFQEPTDEEFEAARARLMQKQKQGRGKGQAASTAAAGSKKQQQPASGKAAAAAKGTKKRQKKA